MPGMPAFVHGYFRNLNSFVESETATGKFFAITCDMIRRSSTGRHNKL